MRNSEITIPCGTCCSDCCYLDRASSNKYDEYYCIKDEKYHYRADSIASYCR